ncbi:hypothetical protein ACWPKS_04330 [Coraliomargarita sp. W4R72]
MPVVITSIERAYTLLIGLEFAAQLTIDGINEAAELRPSYFTYVVWNADGTLT